MPTIIINLDIDFGAGTVNKVPKAKTIVSGRVTEYQDSDLSDAPSQGTWNKSFAGDVVISLTAQNSTNNDYANVYANSGLTGTGLIWASEDTGTIQKITSDISGIGLRILDKTTQAVQSSFVLNYNKVIFQSPDSPLGLAGSLLIDSNGYIYTGSAPADGTVTIVSVASANGFSGTVANDTTTPEITISTTITGLLKGNGAAISQAIAGTDYVTPATTLAGYGITDAYTITQTDSAISAAVVGLLDDRGNFDASVNAYPSTGGSGTAGAILKGDLWTVSVAGTLPTGISVTPGDVVRALVDAPGNTQSNWAIGENNFGYVALNQAMASGTIYVGNISGIGTAVTPSGDVTISNTGVTAIGNSKVTNAMLLGNIDLTTKVTGVLPGTNGGTGVNNGAFTITLAGNVITTGSFNTTLAQQVNSVVTLPNSATSTLIANNLGLSGGSTFIGGTAAGDKLVIQATSNSTHTAAKDLIKLKKNSSTDAATSVLLTIGDGQGLNNDEISIYTGVNTGITGYLLRAGATFAYFNASSSLRLQIAAADIIQLSSSTATMVQGITLSDAKNIIFNTTTGSKIGGATTQKFAFWNKTPIVQPTTSITGATLVGGGGTTITATDTFGGYTLQQLAAIIINTGLAA